MLENLKKKLGMVPNVEAGDAQETVTFSVTDSQQYKELLEGFTEQSAQLNAAVAKTATLEDKVKSLEAQLVQFAAQKEAAELAAKEIAEKALQDKLAARKAVLSAELGDEKAEKMMGIVAKMDDEEFTQVFGVQKEAADKEAASFKELGVDEKPAAAEKQPVHFKTFIKKK